MCFDSIFNCVLGLEVFLNIQLMCFNCLIVNSSLLRFLNLHSLCYVVDTRLLG
ncbi:hypothetical protein HanPSC8_Chr09g0402881 [Helianthus annuus]|nr:hypothetical protein HanPSC8_Chr09g0402881 [Helianthus annuus]